MKIHSYCLILAAIAPLAFAKIRGSDNVVGETELDLPFDRNLAIGGVDDFIFEDDDFVDIDGNFTDGNITDPDIGLRVGDSANEKIVAGRKSKSTKDKSGKKLVKGKSEKAEKKDKAAKTEKKGKIIKKEKSEKTSKSKLVKGE